MTQHLFWDQLWVLELDILVKEPHSASSFGALNLTLKF